MPHAPEPQVTLPWLVRLRWLTVLGQAVAVASAHWGFGLELPWWWLGSLVLLGAASNLLLSLQARRAPIGGASAQIMGGVLAFDTLLLTALLAASGGPMNPFTVLYLVHITLAAVVLSAGWTSLVVGLSFSGFAALFLAPSGEHLLHGGPVGLGPHLIGMWIAFVVAAGLSTYFVRQVTRAIAQQRKQIATLEVASARNARLASITTLAAGAAHELGSPLGTIAIAAHEAARTLGGASVAAGADQAVAAVAEDLQLILLEVERCQEILGLMAARAAQSSDAAQPIGLDELRQSVLDHLGEERAARVEFRAESALELRLPAGQTTQSLLALVRNGLDASPEQHGVTVEVRQRNSEALITVEDRGCGIPEPVLPRVGEPFFTTKQPGRGLGLGVFLVRAFVESRGGELSIESTPGKGTRARMRIPMGSLLPVLA
jgi:two-component system sensor histidine kinase RegB